MLVFGLSDGWLRIPFYARDPYKQIIILMVISAVVIGGFPQEAFADGPVYRPVFYYYHSDHLGSSGVLTDWDGDEVQHYGYTAFGKERYSIPGSEAFSVTDRYTGQKLDEDTGLYFYGSRYYDPELGRFIQPDSIVPSAVTSQALNRYTYVTNNPLKLIDPTGHMFEFAGISGFSNLGWYSGWGSNGYNYGSLGWSLSDSSVSISTSGGFAFPGLESSISSWGLLGDASGSSIDLFGYGNDSDFAIYGIDGTLGDAYLHDLLGLDPYDTFGSSIIGNINGFDLDFPRSLKSPLSDSKGGFISDWLKHDKDYTLKETKDLIDKYIENPFGYAISGGPIGHALPPQIGGLDYKDTYATFIVDIDGVEKHLSGDEFGNYLAGYAGTFYGGEIGLKVALWAGDYFARKDGLPYDDQHSIDLIMAGHRAGWDSLSDLNSRTKQLERSILHG